MRGLGRLVLLAAVCLTAAGCAKQVDVDPWAGLAHPDKLAAAELKYYWNLGLTLDDDECIAGLYQMDENLYCLTSRNVLIAVDAKRGVVKWACSVAEGGKPVFRPTHADGLAITEHVPGIGEMLSPKRSTGATFDAVLVNTLSYVLVLDRDTGRQYRKIALQHVANTGGASDGKYFFYGSTDGWCRAVYINEAEPAWGVSSDDVIKAPVRYYGGRVYFGSQDDRLYAVQVGVQPKKQWVSQLRGPVLAAFHVGRRGCFVPGGDRRIYALDKLTGRSIWQPFVCRGRLVQPIQVTAATIFQYAEGDNFYAINRATGRARWTMPTGHKVLAAMDGDIYLLDSDGNLHIFDEILGPAGGKTTLAMTGLELFVGNTTAAAIFAATRDGRLFCIRQLKAGYLTPEMLKGTK
ncbi:MAG: PQQ-binding-like beta-propeller repeat protein [Phycisphaerae bacterium]|nr:PQQ-binding-like beta-propeller repeat protein [Phycisphaerae bacterium]